MFINVLVILVGLNSQAISIKDLYDVLNAHDNSTICYINGEELVK